MNKIIRIGTRDSPLARWQADEVSRGLSAHDQQSVIQFIKSDGDLDLITPLYEAGIQGIFTRALDIALLEERIDIAVHSYKDVPTSLAGGLTIAAVLKRGNPSDVLVCRNETMPDQIESANNITIATSSIRRKAQWLHKYKNSTIENIRGNVHTRLKKLQASNWQGAIFAAAGLERLNIHTSKNVPQIQLDWMLPAPAQGAVVVICRENNKEVLAKCGLLNHEPTRICTQIERDFLSLLQGGCSTPISALVTMNEHEIQFKGNITEPGGGESFSVSLREKKENHLAIARKAVKEIKAIQNAYPQSH